MKLPSEGLPGWVWPAAFSVLAIVERILAGFNVGKFFEMTNSPTNWMPEILAISLTGFVANKLQKGYVEAKKTAAANLAAYQSRASSSEDV